MVTKTIISPGDIVHNHRLLWKTLPGGCQGRKRRDKSQRSLEEDQKSICCCLTDVVPTAPVLHQRENIHLKIMVKTTALKCVNK